MKTGGNMWYYSLKASCRRTIWSKTGAGIRRNKGDRAKPEQVATTCEGEDVPERGLLLD